MNSSDLTRLISCSRGTVSSRLSACTGLCNCRICVITGPSGSGGIEYTGPLGTTWADYIYWNNQLIPSQWSVSNSRVRIVQSVYLIEISNFGQFTRLTSPKPFSCAS